MDALRDALADPGGFHRLVLVRRGDDDGWSRLVGTPVALRDGVGVKLVATVGTREETETVRAADWDARRATLLAEAFDQAHVLSPAGDVHARRTKKGRMLVSRGRPSRPEQVTAAAHDRTRGRALDPDDADVTRLFIATGLAGESGRIRAAHRDKERQLQHYLELLRPLEVLHGDGFPDLAPARQGLDRPVGDLARDGLDEVLRVSGPAMAAAGRSGAITDQRIDETGIPRRTRLLLVPAMHVWTPGLVGRLRAFLQRGGRVALIDAPLDRRGQRQGGTIVVADGVAPAVLPGATQGAAAAEQAARQVRRARAGPGG